MVRRSIELTFLVLLAIVAGCSGGDGGPSAPGGSLAGRISGAWHSRTEDFGGLDSWARFGADWQYVNLSERDNGIRYLDQSDWHVDDERASRILIDMRGFTVSLAAGDSMLTVVSDHENDTIVYTRVAGIPDPETWLRDVEVLDAHSPPNDDPTDLAWDGIGLWFPGRLAGVPCRRMNPELGLAVDRTLDVPHAGWSIDATDGDLWIDDAADRRIFPPWMVSTMWHLPGRSVRGIAFDGVSWWLYLIDMRGEITTRIVRARLS